MALMAHLVKRGDLDADEIEDMATALEGAGKPVAARLCRASFIQAIAPTQSEWEAERRRARFEVVSDGGNGAG